MAVRFWFFVVLISTQLVNAFQRGSCNHRRRRAVTLADGNPDNAFSELLNKVGTSPFRGVFTYPDLTKYSKRNPVGALFLATNIVYSWAGYVVFQQGQTELSLVVEAAGVASFYYHWTQLEYGPNNIAVVRALLLDYLVAVVTVASFLVTLFEASLNSPTQPLVSFVSGLAGMICLVLSWVYHFDIPYIIFHGLWHVLSGYASASLPFIPSA